MPNEPNARSIRPEEWQTSSRYRPTVHGYRDALERNDTRSNENATRKKKEVNALIRSVILWCIANIHETLVVFGQRYLLFVYFSFDLFFSFCFVLSYYFVFTFANERLWCTERDVLAFVSMRDLDDFSTAKRLPDARRCRKARLIHLRLDIAFEHLCLFLTQPASYSERVRYLRRSSFERHILPNLFLFLYLFVVTYFGFVFLLPYTLPPL